MVVVVVVAVAVVAVVVVVGTSKDWGPENCLVFLKGVHRVFYRSEH